MGTKTRALYLLMIPGQKRLVQRWTVYYSFLHIELIISPYYNMTHGRCNLDRKLSLRFAGIVHESRLSRIQHNCADGVTCDRWCAGYNGLSQQAFTQTL